MILLFLTFLKIGLFTIGGGYAMIPLIKEYITRYSWATNEELLEFIAISESTPGPFAINLSTFIGFKNSEIIGSILCTLAVITPSFFIIILISKFFFKFKESELVQYILNNLKPITLSLIIYSVINISLNLLLTNKSPNLTNILLFITLFLINIKLKLSPVHLILLSGLLGIIFL